MVEVVCLRFPYLLFLYQQLVFNRNKISKYVKENIKETPQNIPLNI